MRSSGVRTSVRFADADESYGAFGTPSASLLRRGGGGGAASLRWQQPTAAAAAENEQPDALMRDAAQPDEFELEFESRYRDTAQQQPQQRFRAGGGGGLDKLAPVGVSRRAFGAAAADPFRPALPAGSGSFDAPPTSSLSAMLAAAQRQSLPLRGASGFSSGVSPAMSAVPTAAALHREFAHFRNLMQSQHQFDWLNWRASVTHWRTVAAGVWFALTVLLVLQISSLSYTSTWPGWRALGWGWSLALEHNPLWRHWCATVLFVAAQVGMMVMRAHAQRTDPSPLYEPLLVRVWRAVSQPRMAGLVVCSFIATLFAGYMAAEVLFTWSPLWHASTKAAAALAGSIDAAAATAAAQDYRASAWQALIVCGMLAFAAWHSLAIAVRLETLLTFPLLRHQGRLRQLSAVVPGLVLSSAKFAAKFTVLFALSIWSWLGAHVVLVPESSAAGVDGEELVLPAPRFPSVLSLSSLPALYHLFLLVMVLHLCSSLCRAFLGVFLTQPLSFHSFFLHALFEQRAGYKDADELAVLSSVNGFDSSAAAAVLPRVDASADFLTAHLVLQYLLDLSSSPSPAVAAARNAALFQNDMNALFGANGPAGDALLLQERNGGNQGQSLPALRSSLPRQPAFVPVLLYCMHHLRLLADSLSSQRALSSHAPSLLRDASDASTASLNAFGQPASSSAGAAAAAACPPAQAWSAFVAVRLDGAGLLFPCKAQLAAQLLAHRRLHELCIELMVSLALHAQAEVRAAAEAESLSFGMADASDSALFPQAAGSSLTASSPAARAACEYFARSWSGAVLSLLLRLSSALETAAHAGHLLSPAQEQALQGHQLARQVHLQLDATLERGIQALAHAYADDIQTNNPSVQTQQQQEGGAWHFPPAIIAKLQAYMSPHK